MSESNGNGTSNLVGKVALVTGASRGIGRAIALELARRGANVAVNFRSRQEEAESVAKEICAMGRRCILAKGNVGDPVEARAIVKQVLDEWGRIDILVNNAGITRDKSVRKLTDEDWQEVIQTNLNGTFYCTSAAIPAMVEQKFGRIVNVSSYGGQQANFGQANYAASKGGVAAFSRVLAVELARYNITVNCVSPGFTETDMFQKVSPEIQMEIKRRIPMGRFAAPDEVAKATAFLVVDGDYVTGQQINVNGGVYLT